MSPSTCCDSSSWQHAVSIPRLANGNLSPSHQCSVSVCGDSDTDEREWFLGPSSTSSAPTSPTRLTSHCRVLSGSISTANPPTPRTISTPRVVPVPLHDRFLSNHREFWSSKAAATRTFHAALTWGPVHLTRHWSPHRPKLWLSCLSLVFFTALMILNKNADSLKPPHETIEISLKPAGFPAPPPDPDERFLGYLPHSGFHNQRGEFQNALLLSKALNRTLLVPAIWLGWPAQTNHYEEMAKSWTSAMILNSKAFGIDSLVPDSELNEPALYPSTLEDFPFPTSKADDPAVVQKAIQRKALNIQRWEKMGYEIRPDGYPITNLTSKDCKSCEFRTAPFPQRRHHLAHHCTSTDSPECRHTYKDAFLAWSWLVNLTVLQDAVKMRDRWDIRERAIEKMLDVTSDDIYVFKDRQNYDFQFVEEEHEDGALIRFTDQKPLRHWARKVSIPGMRRMPQRVLLVGSMFGSDKVILRDDRQRVEDRNRYARLQAFRASEILNPADDICQRLGGARTFVGVHARVGDGKFANNKKENMRCTWENVLVKLGVGKSEIRTLWRLVGFEVAQAKPEAAVAKRGADHQPNFGGLYSARAKPNGHPSRTPSKRDTSPIRQDGNRAEAPHLERRQFQPELIDHAPFHKVALASKLDRLTCRSPLHTSPELLKFNVPLYLATDARSPVNEFSLSPFFRLFPCTFVLSDFEEPNELNMGVVAESMDRFKRLTNKADGLPLERFLTPFLEAVIAAKAGIVEGTRGSTFSGKSDAPVCGPNSLRVFKLTSIRH
ncbi:BQ2448_970 [Microbotryum intermedium]|uniref:BQ2448_970 protein n=1 Tax=Microbotryum intermedium TaxID=269621 RepID=A0A238F7W5_9BASI|nr:BQ2448_970 [Microbotryum intermedium]